ncbi:MAG: hypothetical protein PVG92_08600 [Holophagae bacterium]
MRACGGLPLALFIMRSIDLSTSATRALVPRSPDPATLLEGVAVIVVTGVLGSVPALVMTLRMRVWSALRHS